ncbi:SDR family oxidoreductase [Luteolibacter marinus]|uniref:SDR family oxidoreductase n=1 Tax=Luteolibacter marinus TaxID=2776705 RepID=UPI00186630E0|nr:NAD(P)-dependent oxidoreductase [Luteolibacter marinus]
MRVAITGTTGRVGRALADRLAGDHEVIELPRQRLDMARPGCEGLLERLSFDVLLNPAGLTGLEQCEDDPVLARRVNALAPGALAWSCRKLGKPMLHFSTDYVFDGIEPGLRSEDDPTAPLSTYGKTKAEGEHAVLAAGGAVMRVSWVFGPERAAFPERIVSQALAGERLAAVADKFSLPAYTKDIASWVAAWLGAGCPAGVFHACNGGEPVSWHGMAREISSFLATKGIEAGEVQELKMDEMKAFRAPRPRHTAMATRRLEALLGAPPRPWQEAMMEHLASLLISR